MGKGSRTVSPDCSTDSTSRRNSSQKGYSLAHEFIIATPLLLPIALVYRFSGSELVLLKELQKNLLRDGQASTQP